MEEAGTHRIFTEVELEVEEEDLEELDYDKVLEDVDDNLSDYDKLIIETKSIETKKVPQAQSHERPPLIQDFLRNFFVKHGYTKSLESFQAEYFEKGLAEDEVSSDLYVRGGELVHEVEQLRKDLKRAEQIAEQSKLQWDKFKKERDFHRMHHRRVVQERRKLLTDFERLKRHYEQYEPTLAELRHKYEVLMKEKMLMRLERDRFANKTDSLQEQLDQLQKPEEAKLPEAGGTQLAETRRKAPKKTLDTPWPEALPEPSTISVEPIKISEMKALKCIQRCHQGPISRIAFHPKIPVLASASDDHTWKLWSVPGGELVMSGEGHSDWVSSISFHNKGNLIGTTSGDSTVKLWDMSKENCRHTFTDHTQATWDCSFHPTHDFLVSGSMDHTARVFDTNTLKVRQVFRGHVDSVNSVCFQPFGTNICTASGDKTVSLWDLRSGLCVQTFYGHGNAVNSCRFRQEGDVLVSCDADGLCKLWDLRMVCEFLQIDAGPHSANNADFDGSSRVLAIASGDTSVKVFDLETKQFVKNLDGHEDSVQDLRFEPKNKFLCSAGSDGCLRLWQ